MRRERRRLNLFCSIIKSEQKIDIPDNFNDPLPDEILNSSITCISLTPPQSLSEASTTLLTLFCYRGII